MDIKWKQIKDYPNYYINNFGQIINSQTKRILKPSDGSGYYFVHLFNEFGDKQKRIHRLVAETFIPNPNNLPQVNHKDEDKTNNCVDNLEWITQQDNLNYGTTQQRRMETLTANDRKTKPQPIIQLDKNGNFVAAYPSIREAARINKYSAGNICRCVNGKTESCNGYIWKKIN